MKLPNLNQSDIIKLAAGGAVGYIGSHLLFPHRGFATVDNPPCFNLGGLLGPCPPEHVTVSTGTPRGQRIKNVPPNIHYDPKVLKLAPGHQDEAETVPQYVGNEFVQGAKETADQWKCPSFMSWLGPYCQYWPMVLVGGAVAILILVKR